MLDVLGLDPADPGWATTGGTDDERLRGAVDVLINALLEERATARAEKDWARADAIRDRIVAAGIEIEDTPSGPKWSI
jgi:cysteinyl-tRNA synthetase